FSLIPLSLHLYFYPLSLHDALPISLVVIFLIACYVLKIFFPEQFVLSVENETIITIGNYIDNNKWASIIYGIIIGCVFDYFYFGDRKSTRLNSSHVSISYAVFCLKK